VEDGEPPADADLKVEAGVWYTKAQGDNLPYIWDTYELLLVAVDERFHDDMTRREDCKEVYESVRILDKGNTECSNNQEVQLPRANSPASTGEAS